MTRPTPHCRYIYSMWSFPLNLVLHFSKTFGSKLKIFSSTMRSKLCQLICTVRNVTDHGQPERAFFQKSWTFGLGQTFWAEFFWGIWGIFGRTISTHFGTVSSLSMFSIIQPLFLQKTKPLYPTPKYLLGSGIWIWATKNLRSSLRVSVFREKCNA